MIAVWHIFKPYGMLINNSVVYFDISPVVLVMSTVIAYFIFIFLSLIFKRSSNMADTCEVTIMAGENKTKISAIIDTGNSLKDNFGKSEIIITDSSVAYSLFGENDLSVNPKLKQRYRLIPCNTVSGECLLEGYRCDKAEIQSKNNKLILEKPIIALSKTPINDGYSAIINPEILD
jgi:stage II sporulation protein GA (sporulation sigma-E factor processing peptidase)